MPSTINRDRIPKHDQYIASYDCKNMDPWENGSVNNCESDVKMLNEKSVL